MAAVAGAMAPHDKGHRAQELLEILNDEADPEARYTPPPVDGGPPPGMVAVPLQVITNGTGH